MFNNYFTIKEFPGDVYRAVGEIIKNSQDFEQSYKELAHMLEVKVKNIDGSSLNKLNEALKKNKLIDEKEFNELKEVIKIRNYVNHKFYLEDFRKKYDSYEEKIAGLEGILNKTQFLIFEAIDVIDNKIDKLRGINIVRPTVFD